MCSEKASCRLFENVVKVVTKSEDNTNRWRTSERSAREFVKIQRNEDRPLIGQAVYHTAYDNTVLNSQRVAA